MQLLYMAQKLLPSSRKDLVLHWDMSEPASMQCTMYKQRVYDQETEAEDGTHKPTSRVQKIAAELVQTERKYVEKLHLVDQVTDCYVSEGHREDIFD